MLEPPACAAFFQNYQYTHARDYATLTCRALAQCCVKVCLIMLFGHKREAAEGRPLGSEADEDDLCQVGVCQADVAASHEELKGTPELPGAQRRQRYPQHLVTVSVPRAEERDVRRGGRL